MIVSDLIFLAAAFFVVFAVSGLVMSIVRRRTRSTRRRAWRLGLFIAVYAVVLVVSSVVSPRRFYAPGQAQCFDDWCVTGVQARPAVSSADSSCIASGENTRTWIADLIVSSTAARVRQRASDANAELEDDHGVRYAPCSGKVSGKNHRGQSLSDELGPGDSFHVYLPFRLPNTAKPAGVVIHHGAFPEALIIGSAQAFLHPRPLLRLASSNP